MSGPALRAVEFRAEESIAILRARRIFFAVALLSAFTGVSADLPPSSASPPLSGLLDSGWQVQRRWNAVSANGTFVYDFSLTTWNGAGKVKETLTRSARVVNRGETHRTEILSATKDGRDVTAQARADEEREQGRARPKPKDDFPSPFDPRFRNRYVFDVGSGEGPGTELRFHPGTPFDRAVEGRARYDGSGVLRDVELRLAKRPRFTRNLAFTIIIGPDGYPQRVESGGEVSLIVWKRRFASTLVLRDVRAGETGQEAR